MYGCYVEVVSLIVLLRYHPNLVSVLFWFTYFHFFKCFFIIINFNNYIIYVCMNNYRLINVCPQPIFQTFKVLFYYAQV